MRVINFRSPLTKSSVTQLLIGVRESGGHSTVLVDSPGGEFEFFSVLGPAIERQGITTLAGDVRSAAVILYLLGHQRLATPESTFYFHEVRTIVGKRGEITITDLESFEEYQQEMAGGIREVYQDWLRRMKAAESWFLWFLREKTGLAPSVFLNLMRAEATIGPEEAKHYGITHKVVARRSSYF